MNREPASLFVIAVVFLSIFSYAQSEVPPSPPTGSPSPQGLGGQQGFGGGQQGFGPGGFPGGPGFGPGGPQGFGPGGPSGFPGGGPTPRGFGPEGFIQGGGEFDFEEDFSFGLPSTSFADQEYISRAKLSESMTSVYNWISTNSPAFVAGCRGDREALATQMSGVITQSGEASSVCARLQEEADSCSPDTYCPTLEAGKIPFPPGVKSQFVKAGYKPDQLTLDQIDAKVIQAVCESQFTGEISKQKANLDERKEKVRAKIPELRAKCTEFEAQKEEREDREFDFEFPDFGFHEGPQGYGPEWQGPQGYGPGGPGPQGYPGPGGFPGPQGEHRDECSSPPPRCPGGAPSNCFSGRWECAPAPPQGSFPQSPPGGFPQPPPGGTFPQPPPGSFPQPPPGEQQLPPVTQPPSGTEQPPQQTTAPPPTEPAPAPTQPAPAPAPTQPAPAPEPAPAPVTPAQTAAKRVIERIFPSTGFVAAALEGAEPTSAPTQPTSPPPSEPTQPAALPPPEPSVQPTSFPQPPPGSFPQPPSGFPQPGSFPQQSPSGIPPYQPPFGQGGFPPGPSGFPGGPGFGPGGGPQGFPGGGPGGPEGFGPGGPQGFGPGGPQGFPGGGPQGYPGQGGPGFGPGGPGFGPGGPGGPGFGGPEQLCEASDDEIIDMFVPQIPFEMMEKMKGPCKEMASRIAGDIGHVKVRFAECKAHAAVMCAAKKDAATTCKSTVDNPREVAADIVSQMCRKFGVIKAEKVATQRFQNVVSKFFDEDPALANQLGDTVEKTSEEQKKLDLVSHLFGNGDYANKVKERSEKLEAIVAKLESSGAADSEALAALKEQSQELKKESDLFSSFFNLNRLGRIFGG